MLGTVVGGRYKTVTVLGVGGFGQTYLAEDLQHPSRLRCVVKQFKPSTQDAKTLEIARRLFKTEADTLKRLGQHPQIPGFLGFFEEEQEFYLVQEFIDGVSLNEEFAHRRLNQEEMVDLLKDVLGILEFVHSNRVIHRDIKPGNLIRRYQDGRIVLIDFGAVKEIQTQLVSRSGQTSFTVGIGTQGYTPPEQLAGKPRFCSDIYALGMTVIQAITGLQPSQLPEDPNTSDYLWHGYANISMGLTIILDRMTRQHFTQRYQSATEVLQALQRLSELPTDITNIPPNLLVPEALLEAQTQPDWSSLSWRDRLKAGVKVIGLAAATVTALVLGVRQFGWLEPLELVAYDRMVQLRPALPPDPRLLVVEITEADLQALQRPTPSDRDVARVIANLQQHQPRVIGLDLYRELPQEPGQAELQQQLTQPNLIAIMLLGEDGSIKIPGPEVVPSDRLGFNDLPIDPDNTIRRNLILASTGSEHFQSFGMRVALKYLAVEGITPATSDSKTRYLQIGEVMLPYLRPNSGGYQHADTAGYQLLLDFRAAENVARSVQFIEVLKGNVNPDWVKDKIVLIGTTAPSSKDLFYTPYTTGRRKDYQMAGVVVHTQMVSQILSIVQDDRALFWFWPEWVEMIWIAGWTVVGGTIAWVLQHPVKLGIGGVFMILVLGGTGYGLLLQYGWIPVAAPAIAAAVTGGAVVVYRSHLMQQQQRILSELWLGSNISSRKHTDVSTRSDRRS